MNANRHAHRRPMRQRTIGWTLLVLLVLASFATTLLAMPGAAFAAATNPCDLILHRGFHNATHDEETAPSVRAAAPYGFGAEIDARVTADDPSTEQVGGLIAVHDDTLRRITGGADSRQPETLTPAQLAQVELVNGGKLASVRRLVHAASFNGGRLLIEGKRYPQHEQQWRTYGIELLADAIGDLSMTDRVFVGGTLGFTRAVHELAPQLHTFWRADPSDELTVANAAKRWATVVEANAAQWTSDDVATLRAASLIPATRNADSEAEWRDGWDAGLRVFQTNRPQLLAQLCAAAS